MGALWNLSGILAIQCRTTGSLNMLSMARIFSFFRALTSKVTLPRSAARPIPRMSRIRQANGDDYPESAAENLADALSLLAANRTDGAAYLSGYVVECALKSLVVVAAGNPLNFGHNLNRLSREALNLAALPGSKTARYIPRLNPGPSIIDAPPNGWRETLRYREAGAVTALTATSWLAEAQAVFASTIIPLRIDGLI